MKLTKEQLKDIGIRTLKTAIVAAFSAFAGAIALIIVTDLDSVKIALYNAIIVAGTAAGTAVLNIFVKLFKNLIDDWQLTDEEIADAFGDYNESEG